MKSKTLCRMLAAALAIPALAAFCWWQNNGLMVTEYEYILPAEQAPLDGVRIAQVSDLHSKDFGGGLERLLEEQAPEVVVLTGDLVDRRDTDFTTALELAQAAALLAPTFYVPGNHEASLSWSGNYAQLREGLEQAGVRVLENEAETIRIGAGTLNLIGLLDPGFYDADLDMAAGLLSQELNQLVRPGQLNVLLAHRPSLIAAYAQGGADLAFSGHAHGGQVRLPFVGGLIAPDEGWFPQYTSGLYSMGDMVEVVSRGLGNSIIPQRVFNRPELVVVTLRAQ